MQEGLDHMCGRNPPVASSHLVYGMVRNTCRPSSGYSVFIPVELP